MKNGNYALLGLALSHGITMAITLYLAVLGGNWLDRRFGTAPLFLAVLVIMIVAANFHLLVKDVLADAERKERKKKNGGKGGQE